MITVRCDDCQWSDTVSSLRHLRAWYRAPCPSCGCGEVIDATEVLVVEGLIALERQGLVEVIQPAGAVPAGGVRCIINTAREPMLEWAKK